MQSQNWFIYQLPKTNKALFWKRALKNKWYILYNDNDKRKNI